MKKVLAILLVYSILMTLLVVSPFTANADEKNVTETGAIGGTTGDCTWKIEDGVLTISGNGKMGNDYSPWRSYDFNTVVIENGVASIGRHAFEFCTSLTRVTIPDSVTSIGGQAFWDCTSLTNVTIGNSVTSIGYWAFRGCTELKSVTIPDSVTSIGSSAFSGCKGLTSVTIPASVEAIASNAFYDCTSLTSVTFPASVTDIYDKAFGYYNKACFGETKVKDFTVYGYKGSEAERYANDNNFKFIALDDEPSDPTKTTDREIFGDIDGDGIITVVDSTFLQRYTIHAETPYPIGEKMK